MNDEPTTLWTLARGEHSLTCAVTLQVYGIEVSISQDGRMTVTRVFETGDEALEWAGRKRERRTADGWSPPRG